jgi:hypothetical protein
MILFPSQEASHIAPALQANHLNNIAGQYMGIQQRENDSRVTQMREMRRMQHEQELARIQAEKARQDREGDMVRQILASM